MNCRISRRLSWLREHRGHHPCRRGLEQQWLPPNHHRHIGDGLQAFQPNARLLIRRPLPPAALAAISSMCRTMLSPPGSSPLLSSVGSMVCSNRSRRAKSRPTMQLGYSRPVQPPRNLSSRLSYCNNLSIPAAITSMQPVMQPIFSAIPSQILRLRRAAAGERRGRTHWQGALSCILESAAEAAARGRSRRMSRLHGGMESVRAAWSRFIVISGRACTSPSPARRRSPARRHRG